MHNNHSKVASHLTIPHKNLISESYSVLPSSPIAVRFPSKISRNLNINLPNEPEAAYLY